MRNSAASCTHLVVLRAGDRRRVDLLRHAIVRHVAIVIVHVAAEEDVDVRRVEDRVEVRVRGRLHAPILVNQRDDPRRDGAIDRREIGLDEGELVGDQLGARAVRIRLRREGDVVDETLVERVVDV